MNRLFEKNYKVLKANHPLLVFEKETYDIPIDKILQQEVGECVWNLQSESEMDTPITIWCDQFEDCSYLNIFLIFGFGDYRYVKCLSEQYPDNLIIVYEPCEEILAKQMCSYDLTELFQKPTVRIVAGKKIRLLFEAVLSTFVTYNNINHLLYGVIPNYVKMFAEEFDEYRRKIKEFAEFEVVTRNTLILREDCRGKNFLYNLDRFWKETGISELAKALESVDKTKMPAVIVAAGPSLDKNILLLKEYQDKVFVLCVDAALRTAQKNGVKPNLIISTDPKFKDPTIFDNTYGKNLPLVVAVTSDYRILQKNGAKKFYYYERGEYIDRILQDTEGALHGLNTGGSVANGAFSLVTDFMKFQTVILIGQDLGYPDNRLHAKDVFYDEKEIKPEEDSIYFYVDSVDGGKVLTEENMNMYRLWYENQITDHPELTVIDATEGGALIHGTKIMTLAEALADYTDNSKVDFDALIANTPPLLSETDKNCVSKRIEESYQNIDSIIQKLKKQEKIYDKLDMLNRKGKYKTKEFKDCVKKMREFHSYIEEEPDIKLIQLYTNRGEYVVSDKLQTSVKNTYEEIKLVVDSGRELLHDYIAGAEKLKENWTLARQLS